MRLPGVVIDSYSVELEDEAGFAGDKATKGAFTEILDELRRAVRTGEDPLGDKPTREISRKRLDAIITKGDPHEAAIVHGAIENFAQQLKAVIKRFLKLKSWQDTQRIVVGAGFRDSRIGELAIARTNILLQVEEASVEIELLEGDPDEAALIGTAHLLPAWMLQGHDAMLAADIGGTNIRAGIVELNINKAADLSKAKVLDFERWTHAEQTDLSREKVIERLSEMLQGLAKSAAKRELRLVPVIGVGCPGLIHHDGTIKAGTQNLPGNWESKTFRLPQEIRSRVTRIGDHEPTVILHNDAVMQGLSQLPRMRDYPHWGVFTIGTGLGNARFTMCDDSDD